MLSGRQRMANCFKFPANCLARKKKSRWQRHKRPTFGAEQGNEKPPCDSYAVTMRKKQGAAELLLYTAVCKPGLKIYGSSSVWLVQGKSLGVFTSLHLFCTLLMFPLMCLEHPLEKIGWGCSQVQASFSPPPHLPTLVLLWR